MLLAIVKLIFKNVLNLLSPDNHERSLNRGDCGQLGT